MKYAAHINGDKIQTVREHCRNTADLCQKFCMSFGTENIGRVQGLFHDAGKMTGDFNNYIRGLSAVKRGEIDHSYAGARYLTEIADDKNAGVLSLIARTIISHHGLHDWVDSNCCDYFQKRISSDYDYENIRENIYTVVSEKELSELLDKALSEYKSIRAKIKSIYKGKTDYAFYIGMTERMLQSALMDADRIDTADFMSGELHQEISADERKMLWKRMHDAMEKKLDRFSERKDKISLQRRSISDRCAAFAKNDVKVCRMIVPTGGGKTLSSLRFAVDYCIAHDMERIIYTAPFMSILEQNSDEICSIAGSEYFTEHHSDAAAQLDPEEDSQKYKEYEAHTERWDSPVIATTMVQFLNTLFSSKTASVRRMHRLSRAVIIIDEVQSIPLKCVNLFNLAVNFLTNVCGAAVVLCTATQPANDKTKYPLMLDEKDSMTGDYKADFEVFKRTEITPCIDSYGY
ncbi:MAG: CRISPR-associated endonuclease Cas3'', partial [Oscillospiraceae bacterium]|nr:CRISPR-associated endonuclease Cas3'' [Oscillospiraceae bacterium]